MTVAITDLGEPLFHSKQGGYMVQVGRLNDSAPTYMVTNVQTGVQEYIGQTLPEAIRAADGIEMDLLDVMAERAKVDPIKLSSVN